MSEKSLYELCSEGFTALNYLITVVNKDDYFALWISPITSYFLEHYFQNIKGRPW